MTELPPSIQQKQSTYLFLDIHDVVIQGLIHFCRQPEVEHSALDTFDLWLYILNLGFPREQRYFTKFYQELPLKNTEKTLFDEDKSGDEEVEDGSGGIMIEVWKNEGYYIQRTDVWVTTKNEPIFVLLCHSNKYDMLEFPAARRLQKKRAHNTIEAITGLQQRIKNRCLQLVKDTSSGKGISAGISCGSGARFFKWKLGTPEMLFCHVNWHIDLGSGNPPAAAKATESFIETTKDQTRRGKFQ